MAAQQIQVGDRLPSVALAQTAGDGLKIVSASELFQNRRVILLGLPGAWTPTCTGTHLKRYIELAPSFVRSGFDFIACVAPENPWAVAAWARHVDPEQRLKFFSDGNLDFGRAIGLTTRLPNHFLGTCLQRFVMIVTNGLVERLNIERSATDVVCSTAEHLAQQAGVPI